MHIDSENKISPFPNKLYFWKELIKFEALYLMISFVLMIIPSFENQMTLTKLMVMCALIFAAFVLGGFVYTTLSVQNLKTVKDISLHVMWFFWLSVIFQWFDIKAFSLAWIIFSLSRGVILPLVKKKEMIEQMSR